MTRLAPILALAFAALLAVRTAGAAPPGGAESAANAPNSGLLWDKAIALEPALGSVVFTATDTHLAGRPLAGFYVEGDLSKALGPESSMTFLGVQSGFMYSYLGDVGSGFFGGNFFMVPINLIVGWNTSPWARICVHGGGNLTYLSVGGSMRIASTTSAPGSQTNLYPNAGMDFQASLRKNIGFLFRPDITVTPGNDIYVLAAALIFKFG